MSDPPVSPDWLLLIFFTFSCLCGCASWRSASHFLVVHTFSCPVFAGITSALLPETHLVSSWHGTGRHILGWSVTLLMPELHWFGWHRHAQFWISLEYPILTPKATVRPPPHSLQATRGNRLQTSHFHEAPFCATVRVACFTNVLSHHVQFSSGSALVV